MISKNILHLWRRGKFLFTHTIFFQKGGLIVFAMIVVMAIPTTILLSKNRQTQPLLHIADCFGSASACGEGVQGNIIDNGQVFGGPNTSDPNAYLGSQQQYQNQSSQPIVQQNTNVPSTASQNVGGCSVGTQVGNTQCCTSPSSCTAIQPVNGLYPAAPVNPPVWDQTANGGLGAYVAPVIGANGAQSAAITRQNLALTPAPVLHPAIVNIVTPIPANNAISNNPTSAPAPTAEPIAKPTDVPAPIEPTSGILVVPTATDTLKSLQPGINSMIDFDNNQITSLTSQQTQLQSHLDYLDASGNTSQVVALDRQNTQNSLNNVNQTLQQTKDNRAQLYSLVVVSGDNSITPQPTTPSVTSCNPVQNGLNGLSIELSTGQCDPNISSATNNDYIFNGPIVQTDFSLPGIGQSKDLGQNNLLAEPFLTSKITLKTLDDTTLRIVTMNVVYNPSTGKYEGTIPLGGNLTTGNYKALFRTSNSLWKNIGNISITPGKTTVLPTIALISGDVNGDNVIDLADYNGIISCYGSNSCSQKAITDLNLDGKIDEQDLNILYSGLQKRTGDQ